MPAPFTTTLLVIAALTLAAGSVLAMAIFATVAVIHELAVYAASAKVDEDGA